MNGMFKNWRSNWRSGLVVLLQPLLAIAVGLLAGAIAILFIGESIIGTYAEMWKGAFGSFYATSSTLARATPIILIGLGVSLAFRAGFFNLGAEGQMILGALGAALAAIYMPGPGLVKLLAALGTGILISGLWSAMAGWLDARYRMNLLITTLLLNYIAALFAAYLVSYPLKDTSGSAAMAQTVMIDRAAWLPKLLPGVTLHVGFLIAVAGTVLLYLFMKHTVPGYQVRMLGGNPLFAAYGGVNRGKMMLYSMFVSGAFAGLAGTVEVLGSQYRFIDGGLTAPDYAWSGIMATLLANSHPLGTALAALLIAALQTGGMGVERNTDVPLEIASVIQAVLILFVSAKLGLGFLKWRKARKSNGTV